MAPPKPRRRPRGSITWLPSGAARVSVYGGVDQLTGKEIRLRQTVSAQATRSEPCVAVAGAVGHDRLSDLPMSVVE